MIIFFPPKIHYSQKITKIKKIKKNLILQMDVFGHLVTYQFLLSFELMCPEHSWRMHVLFLDIVSIIGFWFVLSSIKYCD